MTKLGVYGVPGTFPTGKVIDVLNGFDPLIKQGKIPGWSRDAVNSLYFHYKSGVEEGKIKPFHKEDQQKVFDYMITQSSLEEKFIKQFFTALEYMISKNKLDPIFLEIERPSSEPLSVAKASAESVKEGIGNYISTFKWVGIGVAGLAVIYVSWPFIKKLNKGGKK